MKTRIRLFTYTLIPVLIGFVLYKIYMYNTIISITYKVNINSSIL